MSDEKTPVFPFDTGMYKKPDTLQHYTVSGDGEVVEANAQHGSVKGPAELRMEVWADDPDQAADMYRKIGKHLGFEAGDNIKVEESVAYSSTTGRPSAYDPRFTPKGE